LPLASSAGVMVPSTTWYLRILVSSARRARLPRLPRLALALAGAMVILAAALGLAARSPQHQLQQNQRASHAIAAVLTARDATMINAQVGMTGPVLASGLKPGDHLGLTIEPVGGSPHPTTPAILRIAL
jgi:hypothetical protein